MKKDIRTTISYWKAPADGSGPNPENDIEIFLGHADEDNRDVLVQDIRGTESEYSLEQNGFTTFELPRKEGRDVAVLAGETEEYYDELVSIVKALTGANEVIIWDRVIHQLPRGALSAQEFLGSEIKTPITRPHLDVSPKVSKDFLSATVPGGADLIQKSSRWQILGIWKPIKTVQQDPLILTDSRSVPDTDFRDLCMDKTFGPEVKFVSTTLAAEKVSGSHRWHYWSDMTPEEVIVFKHFDTKQDSGAWRCAHASMEIPGTENLPARESVDVRALVGF